ncbi:MAG: hypothetical protein VX694_09105, partial [Planctomycetota bacterium]|nr:hypothetical protein [Planctomycetota bacterium]
LRSFFKRVETKRSIEAVKTDVDVPSDLKASNTTEAMPTSSGRSSSKRKNQSQKTPDRPKQAREEKVNPTPTSVNPTPTSRTSPSSSSTKVTKYPSNQPQSATHQQADGSREDTDVNWSKLSKSERRRLRKQLKRQKRAA